MTNSDRPAPAPDQSRAILARVLDALEQHCRLFPISCDEMQYRDHAALLAKIREAVGVDLLAARADGREEGLEEAAAICSMRVHEIDEVEAGAVWALAAKKVRALRSPAPPQAAAETPGHYAIRRNVYGHAAAITRDSIDVLHLVEGAARNDSEGGAAEIVDALNARAAAETGNVVCFIAPEYVQRMVENATRAAFAEAAHMARETAAMRHVGVVEVDALADQLDALAAGKQEQRTEAQRPCSWVDGSTGARCEREAGHDTHRITRPVPTFEWSEAQPETAQGNARPAVQSSPDATRGERVSVDSPSPVASPARDPAMVERAAKFNIKSRGRAHGGVVLAHETERLLELQADFAAYECASRDAEIERLRTELEEAHEDRQRLIAQCVADALERAHPPAAEQKP